MLKVATVAVAATLAFGTLSVHDAAAQSSGRQRSQGGAVYYPNGQRQDGRVLSNGQCTDQSTYNRGRRGDGDGDDRYENDRGNHKDRGKHKGWYKNGKRQGDDDRYEDGRNNNGSYNNGSYDPNCNYGNSNNGYGSYGSLRDTGWRDVTLRRPRWGFGSQASLDAYALQQVLGRSVFNRFDQQRYRLGVNSPLVGRWLDTTDGSVLNLFAGGYQIAEIIDRNSDGRADIVRLNYGR